MILEFGFCNFFSFKEEAIVSFRLDANCPSSISLGRDYATALGIKGANGSGKTQVLKALSFLVHFITHSFNQKPDDLIGVDPFFGSKESSEFYIELLVNGVVYRYEVELNNKEVKREAVFRTNRKKILLVERIGNTIKYRTAALKQLDAIKLRKNASLISTANQYEIKVLKEFYDACSAIFGNVVYSGFKDSMDIGTVAQYLSTDEDALRFIKDFISACDAGISDLSIKKIKDKEDNEIYYPVFTHESGGVAHALTDIAESNGTKSLFRWLLLYYVALQSGGVAIVDEIDMNLHPHILPKILNLFLSRDINTKNAQLIFATHDTEILEILGRYRTYLVAKEDNESYAYRLDEIPGDLIRNDRPIRPVYNSGRLGGVPRL